LLAEKFLRETFAPGLSEQVLIAEQKPAYGTKPKAVLAIVSTSDCFTSLVEKLPRFIISGFIGHWIRA
jgi:hypothetical protein